MFKNKIIVVNEDWEILYEYKSRTRPITDEFIYVGSKESYYKVLAVIHTRKRFVNNITVMVKKWDFFVKNL